MVDVSRLSQEPGTSSRVPPDEQKRKKEDGRSAAATFILRVNRAIAGADGMVRISLSVDQFGTFHATKGCDLSCLMKPIEC